MKSFDITTRFDTYKAYFEIAKYGNNGSTALILKESGSSEVIAKVSVNTDEKLNDKDLIHVKNYSENLGLMENLIELGMLELVDESGDFPICRITDLAKQHASQDG